MLLAEWQNQLSQALVLPATEDANQDLSALQGVEARRLALYQELMFNTVAESLQSIYPYTYQFMSANGRDAKIWEALVEDYRRAYPNPSHKLMGAVEHFPEFLSQQEDWLAQYPFLSELALYEWLEMQVLNLPDSHPPMAHPHGLPSLDELAHYAPVWNPSRVLQHFEYPIPELITLIQTHVELENPSNAEAELKTEPQPLDILIYRDPHLLHVRFFCLNGLTNLLIQLSTAQPGVAYREILEQLREIIPALQDMPMAELEAQAIGLFQTCLDAAILLGSDLASDLLPSNMNT